MAGHVPDRRPDLRVVRRRHDHRRRDRGARLADRAAGAAVEARRQGRPGSRAVRRPASPRRRRGPDLGRDRRPRPAPAAALGRPRRRAAGRAGGPGAPAADGHARPRHVPAVAPRRADVRADAAGVPRHGAAGERRRQGAERERTGVQAAIQRLEQQALASGRMHEPITVDVNDDATVANDLVPIDGKAPTATRTPSLAALRDRDRARTRSARARRTPRPASPGCGRPVEGQRRTS